MRRARMGLLLVAAAGLWAAEPEGLKPRAAAADYPALATQQGVSIGAALLSAGEVHSAFATDLSRGYMVVEAAVYPEAGKRLDLGPGDFVLRVAGTKQVVRPAGPKTIAAVLQRSAGRDREITLYPQVGVGYESGPRGYDPATGTRRGGGVNTSVGVGVGVGDSQPPASTDQDRKTMETELAEKQLPEKTIAAPAAGYLYFPVRINKKKPQKYELEYDGPAGRMTLPL